MSPVRVGLAGLGVTNELFAVGTFPWVGLTLAFSFGFYGLVRKKIMVDSLVGLGVESLLLLPLAVGYLAWLYLAGVGSMAAGNGAEVALLALGGPLTVIPLVAFAAAAMRLPLTTLGFFQYLAPGNPEFNPLHLNYCAQPVFCIPKIDESIYGQKVCFCCRNHPRRPGFYYSPVSITGSG